MRFLKFLRAYALPVFLAFVGGIFWVLDMIGRWQQIVGMPGWIWGSMAGLLILSAVIVFFYQVHRRIEDALATPGQLPHKLSVLLSNPMHEETKEQRREREEKREAIKAGRRIVAIAMGRQDLTDFAKDVQTYAWFYKLRPHLDQSFVASLIGGTQNANLSGASALALVYALASELDRLEQKWKLD